MDFTLLYLIENKRVISCTLNVNAILAPLEIASRFTIGCTRQRITAHVSSDNELVGWRHGDLGRVDNRHLVDDLGV